MNLPKESERRREGKRRFLSRPKMTSDLEGEDQGGRKADR